VDGVRRLRLLHNSSGYESTTGWYTLGGTSRASSIIADIYALAGGVQACLPALTQYRHPGKGYDVALEGNGRGDVEVAAHWGESNMLRDRVVDWPVGILADRQVRNDRRSVAVAGAELRVIDKAGTAGLGRSHPRFASSARRAVRT
jgi:hypothetical protein